MGKGGRVIRAFCLHEVDRQNFGEVRVRDGRDHVMHGRDAAHRDLRRYHVACAPLTEICTFEGAGVSVVT